MDAHGGGGVRGIKMYPPSIMFAKLVNKNGIKPQKGVLSPNNFHTPLYPPSKHLAKISWTPTLDFQTVYIYEEC
jgi:hypothetical protein